MEIDGPDVRLDEHMRLIEGESKDGACRVRTDTGQRKKVLYGSRENALVAKNNLFRAPFEEKRSTVVTKPPPSTKHLPKRRSRQCPNVGKSCEELRVICRHPRGLRLLEHHLRDQYLVRIGGQTPRKQTAVFLEIRAHRVPKSPYDGPRQFHTPPITKKNTMVKFSMRCAVFFLSYLLVAV